MGNFSVSDRSETPQRDIAQGSGSAADVQVDLKNPLSEIALKSSGLLVIVGGGWVDLELLGELFARGADVVAADGAISACLEAGVMPMAVIGDMDSIAPEHLDADTRVITLEEQETTDFEKCLYSTSAPLTIVMGVTGKRLDHTLAALDALARHAHQRQIVVVDEEDIALALVGDFAFGTQAGQRVSVHPITPVRFARSVGLRYPLDGLVLAPGVKTGTSNEAISDRVAVTVADGETGTWLLILSRSELDRMIGALLESAS